MRLFAFAGGELIVYGSELRLLAVQLQCETHPY